MTGNERQSHDSAKEQNMNDLSQQQKIRTLNDRFRRTGQGGRHMITPGIQVLGIANVLELRRAIAAFDDFKADNDPYGEHDFGSLIFGSARVFWKIDYYDLTLTGGSPDPADPEVTTRVLTIMLASEY